MAGLQRYLPAGLWLLLVLALLGHGAVGQWAHYHDFANQQVWHGVPNGADVLSNAGFIALGAWGLSWLTQTKRPLWGRAQSGYVLFLVGVLLTGLGSAYYHWQPNNHTLVWDRLPIALTCAGLLAGARADIQGVSTRRDACLWTLWGMLSVAWWAWTARAGNGGDLRAYILLQAAPLWLIPLWLWLYRAPKQLTQPFMLAIGCYVLAKVAEIGDAWLWQASAHVISGHTLKHLLATLAVALVCGHLYRRSHPVECRARRIARINAKLGRWPSQ